MALSLVFLLAAMLLQLIRFAFTSRWIRYSILSGTALLLVASMLFYTTNTPMWWHPWVQVVGIVGAIVMLVDYIRKAIRFYPK